MKFFLIITGVILVLWNIGYFRIFLKRLTLPFKLAKMCKKANAKLTPHSPLCYFTPNRSKRCDLFIETETEVLAIKFFAVKGKLNELWLKDDRVYTLRKRIMFFGKFNSSTIAYHTKEKIIPKYDFSFETQKNIKPILLLYPAPLNTVCIENRRYRPFGSGDQYYEMTVMSMNTLRGSLTKDE